jgi:hypothetical protein
MAKACISINEETKNKLRAMGSKGDTYDDVINGLIGLSMIISDPKLAASLAKDCGMDAAFAKKLQKFYEGLIERGGRYRNYDYEAQKLMIRLDLLS